MITPKWHREHFRERAGNKRACADHIVRGCAELDDHVARVRRLEAADLLLEAEYLEDASNSDNEQVLLKAYQVLTEGIFALRQTCVGQPQGFTF
jgi:hypothetical protein